MKKYGWTAGLICLAAGVLAQVGVPLTFNYQGVLKRGDGSVVSPASMPITFKLYDQATAGDALWGREVAVLLDTNGLFNVELSDSAGGDAGVTGSLMDVVAAHQDLYLELTVAASPILPRQKLLAVPFAMRAGDVQQAANDFTVQGTLTVQNGASVHSLTVQNDATVNGSLTVQDNASVAGRIMNDFGGGHYDVWIQGSTDLSANDDSRNLALLGDALSDTLIINDGSSYTNGTEVYGPVEIVGDLTATGTINGMYPVGNLSANIRIAYAHICSDGTIVNAHGIDTETPENIRKSKGVYYVTFSEFDHTPIVMVTPSKRLYSPGHYGDPSYKQYAYSSDAMSDNIACVLEKERDWLSVITKDQDGSLEDSSIDIILIGVDTTP